MLYPSLKAVHFISLALAVAAPAFLWWIWEPAARAHSPREGGRPDAFARRMRPAVAAAAALLAVSGILDALRAASQIFPLTDVDLIRRFFTSASYGRLTAAKAALAAVGCLFFWGIGGGWRRVFVPMSLAAFLGAVYTVSGASHAAARPGAFPVIADMIHVFASAVWGGGLVYLSLAAGSLIGGPGLSKGGEELWRYKLLYALMERFSTLALLCVGAVAATGAFAAYLHVYDTYAAVSTPYGRTLIVKIALFLGVLGVAGYNLMVAGPALRRSIVRRDGRELEAVARTFAGAVKLEAAVIAGVLTAAGVLTTLPPADTPGTVAAGTWERPAGEWKATIDLAPLDRPGGLLISVAVAGQDGAPIGEEAQVTLLLEMTSHRMAVGPLVPARVAPGKYEAETVLPMDGSWRLTVRVEEPGRSPAEAQIDFEAAAGSMLSGRVRRFEPAAAVRTPVRRFMTALGLILVALGSYAVSAGRRRRLVQSAVPLGLMMVALGGYHLLSTTLTDSIPTSHIPNPVPYTLEAVKRGARLYAQHCAVCHGPEGKGDGVLAGALNPPPADLTAEHVDEHTDGDIFWWITHGIEQTAMPALGGVLTEEERWTIIHFVRSLRHFMPALEEDLGS